MDLIGFSDGSTWMYIIQGGMMMRRSNLMSNLLVLNKKVNTIKGTTVLCVVMCGAFLLSRLAHCRNINQGFRDEIPIQRQVSV